jgi:hypothetical protein
MARSTFPRTLGNYSSSWLRESGDLFFPMPLLTTPLDLPRRTDLCTVGIVQDSSLSYIQQCPSSNVNIQSHFVGRNADGRQEIFVLGDDNALWQKWQVAPNNGWSDRSRHC